MTLRLHPLLTSTSKKISSNTYARSSSPASFLYATRTLSTMADGSAVVPHRGFVGRYVLAPMVRSGELPTRMLCLKYGATAVWGTVCCPSESTIHPS